jgi:hypothetical protein
VAFTPEHELEDEHTLKLSENKPSVNRYHNLPDFEGGRICEGNFRKPLLSLLCFVNHFLRNDCWLSNAWKEDLRACWRQNEIETIHVQAVALKEVRVCLPDRKHGDNVTVSDHLVT